MGLDMYLNKMPRYKNATAKEVYTIENYLDWLNAKENNEKYANYTMEEWCGIDESEVPDKEMIEFYKQFYTKRYSLFDVDHEYGYEQIMVQVGYWRKANQIHNFFVENVQDGEDDCHYHHECTKEILEKLLDICEKVKNVAILKPAKIEVGQSFENGKIVPIYESGEVIINEDDIEELLPSCDGFFFGGTQYDTYYMRDIEDTIDILTRVLETTDFEKEMIYYVSSW